jgi:hypothetical protein
MKGVPMGGSFCPDGRQKVMTMIKGSRQHSGKICATTETLPEMLAQRMLGRKLSGGGGSRMTILLMVVRNYHFDCRLVVGSPHSKK